MSSWSVHHQALLSALEAREILPALCARLSCERFSPTPDQVLAWRDWADSIQADPAWEVIEPVLHSPQAWKRPINGERPGPWELAVERGFSARTDHHTALFFDRLCRQSVEDQDYELARCAWTGCIEAWARLLSTDYLDDLVTSLIGKPNSTAAAEEMAAARNVATHLLDDLVAARRRELRLGLGLDNPGDGASTTRHPPRDKARFAWRALNIAIERTAHHAAHQANQPKPGHINTLGQFNQAARQARQAIVAQALDQFHSRLDAIDASSSTAEELAAPFAWVAQTFETLDHSVDAVVDIVDTVVETGWKLRKLELDDDPDYLSPILEITRPFNDTLCGLLTSGSDAFGHNSKCADYLVFVGEKLTGNEVRLEIFQRALKICPGHRNASMTLSYEYLQKVNIILLKMAVAPDFAIRMPGTSTRIRANLASAHHYFELAEKTYPHNTNLPKYRDDLVREFGRFCVPMPGSETGSETGSEADSNPDSAPDADAHASQTEDSHD